MYRYILYFPKKALLSRIFLAFFEKNEANNLLQYLKFTEDALRIIENSTSILFRSMVANEIAKRISSESISVEMKRSEEDRLGIFHIQTLEGGKLKTPSKKGIFRENQTNNDVIDMKVQQSTSLV